MEYHQQWGEFYPPDLILHGEIKWTQMLYKSAGEQDYCHSLSTRVGLSSISISVVSELLSSYKCCHQKVQGCVDCGQQSTELVGRENPPASLIALSSIYKTSLQTYKVIVLLLHSRTFRIQTISHE